jgi:hypothetical protein
VLKLAVIGISVQSPIIQNEFALKREL